MYYSSHQYVSGMIIFKGLRYVDMFVYLFMLNCFLYVCLPPMYKITFRNLDGHNASHSG